MQYDTIILGAGASGLMLGAHLFDQKVLIIDGQETIGKKIAIAGGGRCNFTNVHVSAEHFLGDAAFIAPILKAFDQKRVLEFVTRHGIEIVCEKNNQYFCKTSAKLLIEALKKENRRHTFALGAMIEAVTKNEELFEVKTSLQTYHAKRVVVATGGPSYPKIGASDVGAKIAKHFGHAVVPFESALVGLTLQPLQRWMQELSGLSCEATVRVGEKSFTDALLFAHKGISGPAVLSASLYWKKGMIGIDFLPGMTLKKVLKEPNKLIANQLPLPRRLSTALLEAVGVENLPLKQLKASQWEALEAVKNYTFAPAGTFGLSKAEACRGGVATSELDGATMQSTLIEGLYFIGETVDVTGELGGYNIQWAFSSALRAAQALNH